MPPSQHHEEAPEMVAQIIEATVRVSKADLLRVIQAADKTTHWDYASWLARQRLVDICHGWGSIKGTALIDGFGCGSAEVSRDSTGSHPETTGK